jgi:hypothetical protein
VNKAILKTQRKEFLRKFTFNAAVHRLRTILVGP